MSVPLRATLPVLLMALAGACAERATPAAPADGSAAPAPVATSDPATVAESAEPATEAPVEASAAVEPAGPSEGGAAGEADDRSAEPEVEVEVKNIGMHIGGGPNDKETKAPIKISVEPHFEAFERCFAKADDPTKGGDFGVDLRIEREGGTAKVTEPRTAIKGDAFEDCVLAVFQAIDFQKPKGGATVVSYSLRFTPR